MRKERQGCVFVSNHLHLISAHEGENLERDTHELNLDAPDVSSLVSLAALATFEGIDDDPLDWGKGGGDR
jgi:hypothetical protein